jgi:FMN reductase
MTTIAVVTAGLTQPSSTRLLGDQLAAAVRDVLAAETVDTEIVAVDLRDHAHDLTNNLLTGFPSSDLRAVIDRVVAADAIIAVTPTFSASYSGLFKMFFDVLEEGALAGKPVLMAATGGTERHSLVLEYALRPLFSYLEAIVVPTGVYAATSDFGSTRLHERIDRAAIELVGLLRGHRTEAKPDPYDEPVPFEQLLAN